MRVLHVSSEVAPFAQSGGLADVVAGLPAAQAALGLDAAVIVPLYRGVRERLDAAGVAFTDSVDGTLQIGAYAIPTTLHLAKVGAVRYAFVDCAGLYDRAGTLYGPGGASEFGDNHLRFALLGMAAMIAGEHLWDAPPDVLHVHDWQGGPAAIYARAAGLPSKIVATIHNLAYRGIFPKTVMTELGIPWSMFTPSVLEFYDQVSFLKAALGLADAVTTVSPTYAQEILTPERGEVLDGFLRHDVQRRIGIVNGIDTELWDPATDPALPAHFSRDRIAGKAVCRTALAAEARLPIKDDEPLIGMIARLTGQKGPDLVADIVPELRSLGARLVVLGAGEQHLEDRFRWLADTFDDRVSTTIGFDIGFARRIYAGSDFFVMPSRFEPCGLGQLYAMRYGSIPIVTMVGGLRDTVSDGITGLQFSPPTPIALLGALARGVALFRDRPRFAKLQRAAMSRDSSWTPSAREYVALYQSLMRK